MTADRAGADPAGHPATPKHRKSSKSPKYDLTDLPPAGDLRGAMMGPPCLPRRSLHGF
ncbi:hypothetical protein [Streptomyces sp. NPDC058855]|uniref:hypothetical protein n=1 Tax=Streptomyces sp. NPDC058855 TaxID=3346651 RepID=UPI003697998E